MNPLDYSLCSQTVTIYRNTEEGITRQVAENCHLSGSTHTPAETYGKSLEKRFRLIIPGDFPLLPADRIFAGIGPENVEWESFIPARIPELYEISFVKPCFWEGEITHWEAGHKKEAF